MLILMITYFICRIFGIRLLKPDIRPHTGYKNKQKSILELFGNVLKTRTKSSKILPVYTVQNILTLGEYLYYVNYSF